MTIMQGVFQLLTVTVLSAFSVHAGEPPTPAKPNILLITADDLGLQLGCYGDRTVSTPRLDALAREGALFRNAYVTMSSCSPSRASIFTGLFPHQNGQVGLSHRGFQMQEAVPVLPRLLKNAGYRTGVIGKVHVRPDDAFVWDMQQGGMEGPPDTRWSGGTRDVRRVAREAHNFIKEGEPWFLKISFLDPHEPMFDQVEGLPVKPLKAGDARQFPWLRESWDGYIVGGDPRKNMAAYYNCVSRLDDGVGLVLETLEATGQTGNTLVIFLSDNGPAFYGGKTTCFEAGVRTPLLVRYPPHIRAGRVCDELVSTVDLLPTILALAGIPVPARNAQGEGRSLWPVLTNSPASWRTELFTEMNFHEAERFRPMRAVRDAQWKLIHNLLPDSRLPEWQLFDLQADAMERTNLAGRAEFASTQSRLATSLRAWQERTGDPLLDAATLAQWAAIPHDTLHARGPYTPPPKVGNAAKQKTPTPSPTKSSP